MSRRRYTAETRTCMAPMYCRLSRRPCPGPAKAGPLHTWGSPSGGPWSERELDPDLQLAHRGSRGVDRAVERARHRHLRIAPHRLVEQVERLEPELQRPGPAKVEVANQRRVRVEDARAEHDVAAGVAVGEGVRARQRGRVE